MALETPIFVEPVTGSQTYSAAQLRSLLAALFPVPGVMGISDCVVSQRAAGANASVDVAAGSCAIAGTSISNQGTYFQRSTSTQNVALVGGFPASGHTRTDAVVAQVYDDQSDSSGLMSWTPVWVENGSLDTGTVPTLPANSLLLASIAVIGGNTSIVTANITDARPFAVGVGGKDIQTGSFTITWSASSAASGTVTFPRKFAGTPKVTVSCQAITNNSATIVNTKTGITSSSFPYIAFTGSGGSYTGSVTGYYTATY